MYIPNHFKLEDRDQILGFIKQYNFALLISAQDGKPCATHLPFTIDDRGPEIKLTTHMARANPQWKSFCEQHEVLIVFSGPHAYISPAHYEKEQNVPTWNYVAVHLSGQIRVVNDKEEGIAILERLMQSEEPSFLQQWERLDARYKDGLYEGIVAFEIVVKDIQAKQKMSQNKTPLEQERIIRALHQSEDGAARDMGRHMSGRRKT